MIPEELIQIEIEKATREYLSRFTLICGITQAIAFTTLGVGIVDLIWSIWGIYIQLSLTSLLVIFVINKLHSSVTKHFVKGVREMWDEKEKQKKENNLPNFHDRLKQALEKQRKEREERNKQ